MFILINEWFKRQILPTNPRNTMKKKCIKGKSLRNNFESLQVIIAYYIPQLGMTHAIDPKSLKLLAKPAGTIYSVWLILQRNIAALLNVSNNQCCGVRPVKQNNPENNFTLEKKS